MDYALNFQAIVEEVVGLEEAHDKMEWDGEEPLITESVEEDSGEGAEEEEGDGDGGRGNFR